MCFIAFVGCSLLYYGKSWSSGTLRLSCVSWSVWLLRVMNVCLYRLGSCDNSSTLDNLSSNVHFLKPLFLLISRMIFQALSKWWFWKGSLALFWTDFATAHFFCSGLQSLYDGGILFISEISSGFWKKKKSFNDGASHHSTILPYLSDWLVFESHWDQTKPAPLRVLRRHTWPRFASLMQRNSTNSLAG